MMELKNAEMNETGLEEVTGGVSQANGGIIMGDRIDVETRYGQTYYYYYVAQGDKLGMIAAYFRTTVQKLMAMNTNITNPDAIYVGQRIRVPGQK